MVFFKIYNSENKKTTKIIRKGSNIRVPKDLHNYIHLQQSSHICEHPQKPKTL